MVRVTCKVRKVFYSRLYLFSVVLLSWKHGVKFCKIRADDEIERLYSCILWKLL
jgi:hypothetical protein